MVAEWGKGSVGSFCEKLPMEIWNVGQIKESIAFHDGQHNHKTNFTKNDNIKHFKNCTYQVYFSALSECIFLFLISKQ